MMLFFLLILTSFLLNMVLPWWSIAIPGLILGYQFHPDSGKAFGTGFLALFVLWTIQALYVHISNDGILSTRVAEMLSVNSPWVVILITGILGGLVSGLSTLTGSLIKKAVASEKHNV